MPESPKNFKDAGRSLLEYAPKVDEKGNITGFDDNSANYDADKNPYGFLVPDTSPKNPKPDYRKDKDYNYKFLRYAYDENLPTGVKEQNVNSALMSGYLLSLGRGFKPGTSAGTGNSTINIQGTVIKTPYAGESLNVRDLKSDCSTLSKGALQYNGLRTNGPGTAAKGYAYTKHFYEQMPECNLAGYYPYNVGGYIGGICYTYDASLIPNVNFKYMSQLALIPPLVERVSYIIK